MRFLFIVSLLFIVPELSFAKGSMELVDDLCQGEVSAGCLKRQHGSTYQEYDLERAVMHCLIDDLDVGSMMVQAGVARDYSRYSGDYYQYEEDRARSMKRGIWNNELQNEK